LGAQSSVPSLQAVQLEANLNDICLIASFFGPGWVGERRRRKEIRKRRRRNDAQRLSRYSRHGGVGMRGGEEEEGIRDDEEKRGK